MTKEQKVIVETKDEFPMMVEALFIKLLSDEDASFQSMYRRFVRNYEKCEMVVLDLQNRSVTRRQSAMLFGWLLVEKQYGVVFFEHFRMEDVEEICHGIDDVYMKRFPKLTETQHINLIPEELMPKKK